MAIRQGFFNSPDSQAPDRLYFAENWNDINDITFGDGYSLKKTPNQTFVTYNPAGVGEILIDIIDFAALLRGYYYVQESETIQKALPLATQDRIDLIVLRLQGNSSASRVLSVEVIQGVEAPVPVAPPINTGAGDIWDLVLAQVYVTGGEATLPNGQSDITMIIAKMELAGFAAEATRALQDEAGRNIKDNLKLNTYNEFTDLGITDTDLTNGNEFASFSTIVANLPSNSAWIKTISPADTNLISILPKSRGQLIIFKSSSDTFSFQFTPRRDNEEATYFGYLSVASTPAWSGWKKVYDEGSAPIKGYDSLESIGLTDAADMSAVDLEANIEKIFLAMDKVSQLRVSAIAGVNNNLLASLQTEVKTKVGGNTGGGNLVFDRIGTLFPALDVPNIITFYENNYPTNNARIFIGNFDNTWRGFTALKDAVSNSNDSFHKFSELELTDADFSPTDWGANIGVIVGKMTTSAQKRASTSLILQFGTGGATPFPNLVDSFQAEIEDTSNTNFMLTIVCPFDESSGAATTTAVNRVVVQPNNEDNIWVGSYDNTWQGFRPLLPILLEDFGSGLAVTTDVSSLNATVITTKADKEIYSSCMLLVGGTNNQRRFIEIELDTFTQTSQAFDFTKSPTIGTDIFDDFQAKIFVDQPANQIEAYEARNRKWDGVAANAAVDVTFSSLRIFKVWGIKK